MGKKLIHQNQLDGVLGEAITLADFQGKKVDVEMQRASLEREMRHIEERQQQIAQSNIEMEILRRYCHHLKEGLSLFDTAERFVLDKLNIRVKGYPGRDPEIEGFIPVVIDTTTI